MITSFVLLVIAFVCIGIGSAKLNRRFQAAHPECQSYRWGYAFGLFFLVMTLLPWGGLIWFLIQGWEMDAATIGVGSLLGGCSAMLGLVILLRDRQALILGTILTLNPILWVINGVYIANRWSELTGGEQNHSLSLPKHGWYFLLDRAAEVSRAFQGKRARL